MEQRHGDWLPSREEIEEMIADQARLEEEAMTRGELTLFELCARWFLPGISELPLYTGRAPGRIDWQRFPERRRGHIS